MDYPIVDNIPTIAESGDPDFEFVSWTGFWRPVGVHQDQAARLSELVNRALRTEAAQDYFKKRGLLTFPSSPQQLEELQAPETQRWGRVMKIAGISPERRREN
jgi:tripartite-type tricarboxylate transporter receptor subunit TctC